MLLRPLYLYYTIYQGYMRNIICIYICKEFENQNPIKSYSLVDLIFNLIDTLFPCSCISTLIFHHQYPSLSILLQSPRFLVNKPYAFISSSLTFWVPVLVMLSLYHRYRHCAIIYMLYFCIGSTWKPSATCK